MPTTLTLDNTISNVLSMEQTMTAILKKLNYFGTFEKLLWLAGVIITIVTSIIGNSGLINCIASLIGVTALIYVAKGNVVGQILMIIFGIMYGIISFNFGYYGESITYMGMTVPMAILATISWIRHPHNGNKHQVAISHLTRQQKIILPIATVAVTVLFYYLLGWLGTASLLVSTLSIATTFIAVYLTYCRSPYYAIAYAFNDIVLIVLWIIASIADLSNLTITVCFALFLVNDIYGYINWKKMHRQQQAEANMQLNTQGN